MIELTRLNGETFTLNAFMIEQIQSLPDTTITLTNGKKIVVQTNESEVIRKITDYYQLIGLFGIEEKQVKE
ncbi:flagellar FlbD family protein [Pseudogracilibacillus auburnensis]|uniref:Flagellar protein FlbD n=1 Tax=Pseudogracilibacillus auburnensis TaxID=1494959 RepID=A0A2V3W5Z8_9BACI|nr:flagellar FlbD family protein [Pseudogracilibacillus auburnensis]MBO1003800.1 flagellar FlbD family protein [Pseudogracilibacillus auburnensis]PXW88614.1 flagellar protein FlbD [Pseudogracilibacillus auburnensis]